MLPDVDERHIAIVGMAGRFPGAGDIDGFWQNLAGGVDSITSLTEDGLRAAGVPPEEFENPAYVRVAALIDDMEGFDAGLFGFTPREAEICDPQHRLFLETCHAALQHGGYDVARYPGVVGVYGGAADNTYAALNVQRNPAVMRTMGQLVVGINNQPDYLATRVSYTLGLRGPSTTVATACSTSLVALHLAGQALRHGDCDLALAGGVEVCLPYRTGYIWSEGSIYSRGGRPRPFDAGADGTVFGTGVGVVLVKRLAEALADRDTIFAVIRGSAVNNDGATRSGFTAPGAAGQTALIRRALANARVHPDTIGFVEGHGTGTLVGDPIEVEALTAAYREAGVDRAGSRPIGSVKGNIGHLGPAAGAAGLIKAVLAIRHGMIPPTVNFAEPNPRVDFADSPFYVNTEPVSWPVRSQPRRAGVSSFGIGGTNAHVIIEEPPHRRRAGRVRHEGVQPRPPLPARTSTPEADSAPGAAPTSRLLPVSAATGSALAASLAGLAAHLADHPDVRLDDLAHTLRLGRPALPYRSTVLAGSVAEAHTALACEAGRAAGGAVEPVRARSVVFLFPGQGAQHAGMAAQIYRAEPGFAADIDRCATLLAPLLELDLRELLFAAPEQSPGADAALAQTSITQPALFAVEYALARLWQRWGVEPAAMVGHSVGEFVAACLAGVFSLEDALALVAARGRLMQEQPPGMMLSVALPESEVTPFLVDGVGLAAVNGPKSCVVAGPAPAIDVVRAELVAQGVPCHTLRTSHAFHTAMMEPVVAPFTKLVGEVRRDRPVRPFVSTLTGDWITPEQAVDPQYWADQLRAPVRMWEAVRTLLADSAPLPHPLLAIVEVGPGQALSSLVRQQVNADRASGGPPVVTASMPHQQEAQSDVAVLLAAAGRLWSAGAPLDWEALPDGPAGGRVPLPAYPYERTRFWVEPVRTGPAVPEPAEPVLTGGAVPIDSTLSRPVWRPVQRHSATAADNGADIGAGRRLVLVADDELGRALAGALEAVDTELITVGPGDRFEELEPLRRYRLRPAERADYEQLAAALAPAGGLPGSVLHAWAAGPGPADPLTERAVADAADAGFYSLLFLAQALAKHRPGQSADISVVTSDVENVSGAEHADPGRAMVLGCCQLINVELPEVTCRSIDLGRGDPASLAEQVVAEITMPPADLRVAYRGASRWVWGAEPLSLPEHPQPAALRPDGVYLITGGLGGIGLAVAQRLAESVPGVRLVLTARSALPARSDWEACLDDPSADERLRATIGTLRKIQAAGAELLLCQADVADEAEMREAATRIREAFGPVNGVFHAAGVPGGGMLAVKTREAAEEIMRPKVQGTLVLDRLFGPEVEFLVLFSSIVSVTGEFGLVDYCAANHFLDAFAHRRVAGPAATVAVNWCAWSEVGMAENADQLAPHLFRELQGGARFEPVGHPLLDRRVYDDSGQIIFSAVVDSDSHWVFSEHRMAGHGVLPGTAYLELVRAAFSEATGATTVQLREVGFLRLLTVAEPHEVRVVITGDPTGECDFRVISRRVGDSGEYTEHAVGRVAPALAGAPGHDLASLHERCRKQEFTPGIESPLLTFGPRWHSIEHDLVGDGEQLIELALAGEYAADCQEYGLHPALLDNATAIGLYLPEVYQAGKTYLPLGYQRLTYHAPMPSRCFSYVRHQPADPHQEVRSFDIAVLDDSGRELVTIDGFMVRVFLPEELAGAADPAVATSRASTMVDAHSSVTPAQGLDILWRILAHRPGPQVVVCPEGLDRKLGRVRGVAAALDAVEAPAARMATSSPVPRSSDTPYVAPDTPVSRTIAVCWQEALGVDEVGLRDDFFALGGNSLVVVQLVARIRELFLVELPVAAVFDHPTLGELAQAVDELLLAKVSELSEQEAAALLARLDAGQEGIPG